MTVDVVIVANYSNTELKRMTEECILSLRQSEKEIDFNVAVEVDDGVDFNYNRAICSGLEKGNSEIVMMANNDLLFHFGFMTAILMAYESGIAKSFGCWNPGHHERFFVKQQDYYFGYRIKKELTGWVIITTRTVLATINFCNEKTFRTSFWWSDNLYADLLKKHAIKHALVRNSLVTHLLNQTLKTKSKKEQFELTKGQRKKYLTGIK